MKKAELLVSVLFGVFCTYSLISLLLINLSIMPGGFWNFVLIGTSFVSLVLLVVLLRFKRMRWMKETKND